MFARPMRSTYASAAPRPTASGHLDVLVAGPPQNSRSVQVAPVIAVAGDRRHIGGSRSYAGSRLVTLGEWLPGSFPVHSKVQERSRDPRHP